MHGHLSRHALARTSSASLSAVSDRGERYIPDFFGVFRHHDGLAEHAAASRSGRSQAGMCWRRTT